jgi:hypothetical protein
MAYFPAIPADISNQEAFHMPVFDLPIRAARDLCQIVPKCAK